MNQYQPPQALINAEFLRFSAIEHPANFNFRDLFDILGRDYKTSANLRASKSFIRKHWKEAMGDFERLEETEYREIEGADYIYPLYTKLIPANNRFNNQEFGAIYVGDVEKTIIEETTHKYKAGLGISPPSMMFKLLAVQVDGQYETIVDCPPEMSVLYSKDPADRPTTQAFARSLRFDHNSAGIHFQSVRHPPGYCLAVFRPSTINYCRHLETVPLKWDGTNYIRAEE